MTGPVGRDKHKGWGGLLFCSLIDRREASGEELVNIHCAVVSCARIGWDGTHSVMFCTVEQSRNILR